MCARVCVCFFFSELTLHIYCLETYELIRAFCIFFLLFVVFVNYSQSWWRHVAQKHCCCEERTNHDHQWKVYLRCCVRFSTSSGCLKSGALFFSSFGQASARHIQTLESHSSHCCLLFHLCPFFPHSICCQGHPHGTRQFTFVTPVCCHYVKPSFKFLIKVVVRLQHIKPKLTEKKKKKNTRVVVTLFAVNVLHFVFFLALRTVTSFVFHSSHTCFEHHLYVALYLCNSCSCDYDGLWI